MISSMGTVDTAQSIVCMPSMYKGLSFISRTAKASCGGAKTVILALGRQKQE